MKKITLIFDENEPFKICIVRRDEEANSTYVEKYVAERVEPYIKKTIDCAVMFCQSNGIEVVK